MLGLIYKDYLLMKKEILMNGIIIVLASVLMFLPWETILQENAVVTDTLNGMTLSYVIMPLVSYFLIFIILSGIQSNVFILDEKKRYSAFVISTPMTAQGQVLSKYYEVFLVAFAGFVWGGICDMITSLITGVAGSAMTIYATLFFVQIFLRAIDIPFTIRFGQKQGRMVKLFVLIAVTMIFIVYGLFGPIPEVDSNSVIEAMIRWFLDEKKLSVMLSGIISLFPYVAFGMYYVSYKISVKLYRRGIESYEC